VGTPPHGDPRLESYEKVAASATPPISRPWASQARPGGVASQAPGYTLRKAAVAFAARPLRFAQRCPRRRRAPRAKYRAFGAGAARGGKAAALAPALRWAASRRT